jgi:hypothetical protein
MVEEMNRYDETPQEVMKMLNARPEFSGETRYKVELQVKGVDIPEKDADTEWVGNPLTQHVNIDYKVWEPAEAGEDPDYNWENCRFAGQDLKQVDAQTGKFVFMNEEGNRVVLQKVKEKAYHWDAF